MSIGAYSKHTDWETDVQFLFLCIDLTRFVTASGIFVLLKLFSRGWSMLSIVYLYSPFAVLVSLISISMAFAGLSSSVDVWSCEECKV